MRSQRSASYQTPTPPCRLDQTLLGTHVADAHRPYTSCSRPLRSYELAPSFGASNPNLFRASRSVGSMKGFLIPLECFARADFVSVHLILGKGIIFASSSLSASHRSTKTTMTSSTVQPFISAICLINLIMG